MRQRARNRLIRAIGRFCGTDHACEVRERVSFRTQLAVEVRGDRVWRFTSHAIGADCVPHPDDVGVAPRLPLEAEVVQFCEVCVISGVGGRNRSASGRAAPTITGIVSLASQRREDI